MRSFNPKVYRIAFGCLGPDPLGRLHHYQTRPVEGRGLSWPDHTQ